MAKPAFKTTDTGDLLMAADTIGLGVERCSAKCSYPSDPHTLSLRELRELKKRVRESDEHSQRVQSTALCVFSQSAK